MGLLLLLVICGAPCVFLFWLLIHRESQYPRGRVELLRDERGKYVMGDDGKPLVVDEYGKIFTYDQGMSHMRRGIRNQRFKDGCLGWILSLWLFRLLNRK